MPPTNRVTLITGASSGIGRAIAQALSGRGDLFLVGRNAGRLEEAAASVKATPLVADLTRSEQVAQVARSVSEHAGRLDLLINCAGALEVGQAEDLGPDVAERLMRTNFLTAVSTIHACLPLLRLGRRPSIVNVSSIAGRFAPPFMAAYAASKFALNGYSHALRQELRAHGIHVCLVQPGPVATPMTDGKLGTLHYPIPPGIPVLTPERVARAVVAAIERRRPEVLLPRRLAVGAWIGSAFPGTVDRIYAGINWLRK